MEQHHKTISRSFFRFFSLLFILAPVSVFAFSLDTQQQFTDTTTTYNCSDPLSHWCVTSGGNGYQIAASSTSPVDNADPNSNQYAKIYSNTTTTTGVTVTYTDPSPAVPNGSLIEFDIYDPLGVQVGVVVTDTTGTQVATSPFGSNNILPSPGCFFMGSNPSGQTATDLTWDTVFVDVSAITNPIKTVQIILQDNGSMSIGSGFVAIDNLREQPIESCYTATFTSTPGPNTPTMTPTQSPTQTNTSTPTKTSTPLNTNTVTNTPSFTPTVTMTSTPGITQTPTMTATATAGPCQPYVYPNPMDFTINHNLAYNANGYCDNGNGKCIVFNCMPIGATLKIYTVSLALVREFPTSAIQTPPGLTPGTGMIIWDGTVNGSSYVASGLYFYVVNSSGSNTFGKFAISKSIHGP